MKIFCIGFHKTGTKSLARALRILGYSVTGPNGVKNADIAQVVNEIAPQLVARFDAFQDNPWPLLYREMDRDYPGSKFILTIRDTDSWLKSVVSHFGSASTPMRKWIYGHGAPLGHEAEYTRRYEEHNRAVVEYFKGREQHLLVVDLSKGDGWEKLCPFLNREIPEVPFPHENRGDRWRRSLFKQAARWLRWTADHAGRDVYNRLRYGRLAPRMYELIWVDPARISRYVPNREIRRVTGQNRDLASGRVVDWSEFREIKSLFDQKKFELCSKHWVEGVDWEALGYFEFMSTTNKWGKCSRSEIEKRCEKLDALYEEVRLSRRLKTRKEIDDDNWRELGGILVHIAANGEPVFGGHGHHRLAIARILGIERMPACLGVVDRGALEDLDRYRRRNAD